jgi:nitric oxide synthase-interacting protein
MGRGSRHSKNAGTMGSEALTYAEKRTLGYGIAHERLGKESFGNFNDCQLSMKPAIVPVCTPYGIIFSKEAILECLIEQAKAKKLELKEWKRLMIEKSNKRIEFAEQKFQTKMVKFDQKNIYFTTHDNPGSISNKSFDNKTWKSRNSQVHVSGGVNIETNRARIHNSVAFWCSPTVPRVFQNLSCCMKKPKNITVCPITGVKLKLGDLIQLKFTKVPTNYSTDLVSKYMDPITRDVFSNRSHLVCLRETGDVMLYDVYKKFVEPFGTYNGYKIQNSSVIELQKGGTGFVAHDGSRIKTSKRTFLGLGSGLTDLRGQHSGSGAKSGLVLI